MSHRVDANRGIDGNKKVEGRKRHVVTDSLGLVIGAAVHPANVHDGKGAMLVLDGLRGASRRLTRWVVERTFAWMVNFRGQTIDYEFRPDSTVAMIYLANCRIALNKLLKHAP